MLTTAGDLELRIPKRRRIVPSSLLERRRSDQAQFAVIIGAYLQGVSSSKVADLVQVLGGESDQHIRDLAICADLDEEVCSAKPRRPPRLHRHASDALEAMI